MATAPNSGEAPQQAPPAPEDRMPDPSGLAAGAGAGAVALPIATAAGTAAAFAPVMPAVAGLYLAGRTLANILKLLRRFFKLQRQRQRWAMVKRWKERGLPVMSALPGGGTDLFPDLAALIAEEERLQGIFERKVEERVTRDVLPALELPDAERRKALDRIQAREERYTRQRVEAQFIRQAAAVDREYLRRVSPEGAVWKLDPNKKEHTPECVAASRVGFFTWEALALMWPPVHAGCGCHLTDPALGGPTPGAKLNAAQSVKTMLAIKALHDH